MSEQGEVYVTITTPHNRTAMQFLKGADDELLRGIFQHGNFTMIPEGQLPVTVAVRNDEQSALYQFARDHRWI